MIIKGPCSIPGGGGVQDFSWLLRAQTGPGHSASYIKITGACPGSKSGKGVGLATLHLPSAVVANMWILASTSRVPLWPVMGITFNFISSYYLQRVLE